MNLNNNISGLDQIVGTPSKLILIYTSEIDYKLLPSYDYLASSEIRLTNFILGITYDETSGQLRPLDIGNSTKKQRQIEQAVTGGKGYEGRLPRLYEHSFKDGLKEYLGCLDVIDEMTQIDGAPLSRLFESPLKQLMERNHVQIIERDINGTSITNIPAGYPIEGLSYKDLLKEFQVIHDVHLGAATI